MNLLRGEEILDKLRELFSKADRSVKLCSAWVKGDVLKELLSLLREGVRFELIVRASSYEDLQITDPQVFKAVNDLGGKLYLNPKLHAKFVVVDGREALLGSANITHSGLMPEGNVETAVYIKETKRVKELEEGFEDIKSGSYDFSRTVAFVVSLDTAREGRVILVREVQEQTYVRIPTGDGNFFLGRLFDIRSVNLSLSGFEENDMPKDSPFIREVFSQRETGWRIASLFGRSQEGVEIKVAKFEVLGEYERERNLFKTPIKPVRAGSVVEELEVEEKSLRAILLKNHSGYDMRFPTYLGRLQGTEVRAYLDMDKVVSMHMAVIGATGSGKTTFVKKVLKNFGEPTKVFIFDMYGEYASELKELGSVKSVDLPNVLIPMDGDDLKRLLKESGLTITERSNDEKELMSFFRKHLKPELGRSHLQEKSLETLLKEGSHRVRDRYIRDALIDVLDFWKETYGEESVRLQPEVFKALKDSLRSEERVVIYNYRDVDITETRVNVAGLVMREILKAAKSEPSDRLIVLEEAHNFAPERGTSEVQAGRENLAYISARRIAMEGRKLRLGLIAVTQRPANISKFILSQLNTQVIFKLITRNDLEAVSPFFEQSKEDVFNLLPFLKPGTAYISGLAVPFSFLFQMEEIPYW
ncbi:helicase HerA domain-containing protein [Hydrogenivirga sp.]